jgi:hypothetical protein
MYHTPKASTLRTLIKEAGIKARVRVSPGDDCIQVYTCVYGIDFTEEDQYTIRNIAKNVMDFTWVRGMEIVVDQMTNPHNFNFYVKR